MLVVDTAGTKGAADSLFSLPFFPLSFLSSCECFARTHTDHRYAFQSLDCSNKAFKAIVW